MKTLDELKREAIVKLCDGCVKQFNCERKDHEKFYFINFQEDRPCSIRRKKPERKKL